MGPVRVVGENVLALDDNLHVCAHKILVMSGVYVVGARVNDPVVVNDHNIYVYRPTLTVPSREYSTGLEQVQKQIASAQCG